MNAARAGKEGEDRAAAFLEGKGLRILERNYRNRRGEIDLIGFHEGYLVFVEVKYRRNAEAGLPEEAVGLQKQRQICRVADHYRAVHGIGDDRPIRYDVIAMCGERIAWYPNAFFHIYR